MTDTPERDVVERLVEQLNICADDPMWADHCEMRKETARRAADTITSLRAQLREARAKAFEEAAGIANDLAHQLFGLAIKIQTEASKSPPLQGIDGQREATQLKQQANGADEAAREIRSRAAANRCGDKTMTTPLFRDYALVPKVITEDMANEMECQFSTEAQYDVLLKSRPTTELEAAVEEVVTWVLEPIKGDYHDICRYCGAWDGKHDPVCVVPRLDALMKETKG